MTAISTVVVVPTNTGSVPRGPSRDPAAVAPSGAAVSYSVWYHGPQEPSARLARTRVDVPARSPVSATRENGVSWLIWRTVTPPPRPTSGCSASWVPRAGGDPAVPRSRVVSATQDTMTTVATMAVSNVVGPRLGDTSRCYLCF
ncbi:hypothetical protein [Mycobacterium sp. E3339]|uniref:hypothetical protein n=1 Tax=Mycobacterium sp. E3339 TaxID=1834146 RepID=UPI0007FD3DB0|nr:hypothetical protein [Mycobacterium sp. E3339]OBG67006.1 hypothetical protein A5702_16890 [Mycobacterium sp. E3339]